MKKNLEKEVKEIEKRREQLIIKNSEKRIAKTIEDLEKQLDHMNGMLQNLRAFFYHYVHAQKRTVEK